MLNPHHTTHTSHNIMRHIMQTNKHTGFKRKLRCTGGAAVAPPSAPAASASFASGGGGGGLFGGLFGTGGGIFPVSQSALQSVTKRE